MSKSSERSGAPVKRTSITELDQFTGHLLRRAQQEHASLWASLGPKGLTSPQFAALCDLHLHPGSSQIEVGDRIGIDRSTLAEMLGRLVERGLLDSERDPRDGRRKVMSLTAAGESLVVVGLGAVEDVNGELVSSLTGAERAHLNVLLTKLLAR